MKLKVHLVPIHLSNLNPGDLEAHGVRKFLHLTPPDIKLESVIENIKVQFKRLYPRDGDLSIEKFQSFDKCDLDPEFIVNEVLENGESLRLVVMNQILDFDGTINTPNRTLVGGGFGFGATTTNGTAMNGQKLNGSNISHGPELIQSTPMVQPAPVLINRKRNAQFFETKDDNIPTKKANITVEETKEESDVSLQMNESNITLPPPEVTDDRIIPQKKPQKSIGGKRVTSGMLNLPVHTQLEAEQAISRLEGSRVGESATETESSEESEDGDEVPEPQVQVQVQVQVQEESQSMDIDKDDVQEDGQADQTYSQDYILDYLKTNKHKTTFKPRSNSESKAESKDRSNSNEGRSNGLLKSLQINMVPDKVYPQGDDRRRRSSARIDDGKIFSQEKRAKVIENDDSASAIVSSSPSLSDADSDSDSDSDSQSEEKESETNKKVTNNKENENGIANGEPSKRGRGRPPKTLALNDAVKSPVKPVEPIKEIVKESVQPVKKSKTETVKESVKESVKETVKEPVKTPSKTPAKQGKSLSKTEDQTPAKSAVKTPAKALKSQEKSPSKTLAKPAKVPETTPAKAAKGPEKTPAKTPAKDPIKNLDKTPLSAIKPSPKLSQLATASSSEDNDSSDDSDSDSSSDSDSDDSDSDSDSDSDDSNSSSSEEEPKKDTPSKPIKNLPEPSKPILEKLPSQTADKPELHEFMKRINLPKLNSFSDLAKNGIPEVKDKNFKPTSKPLKDLDSSGSDDEDDDSDSDSDSDSSDDEQNSKFIKKPKKTKKNQGFRALLQDAKKRK